MLSPQMFGSRISQLATISSKSRSACKISSIHFQQLRKHSNMAGFTVLTDSDVQSLLRNSGPTEVSRFADILTKTFHDYSMKNESQYQPHRANVVRPSGQNTLFMPSTAPDSLGVKIVIVPSPNAKAEAGQKPPGLECTLTLCDGAGKATGVLNAAELTAFRTSLGAMLLFRHRKNVRNIVMFGSGKQAYWHLRLALIMKGKDIETITIINRSKQRAEDLVQDLHDTSLLEQFSHIKVSTHISANTSQDDQVKSIVQRANSIHCCVPSLEPLFPAHWLGSAADLAQKDLYISAIGSYRLDMQEIDPKLLQQMTSSTDLYVPKGYNNPVIVVDSVEACFQEAGEIVKAELEDKRLIEIGALSEIIEKSMTSELERWLSEGLVVYKSVGVGVMDICIGKALIDLAREKNVGVTIDTF